MLTTGAIDFPWNNPLAKDSVEAREASQEAGVGKELGFLRNYLLLPVSLASFKAAGAPRDKKWKIVREYPFLFLSVFLTTH